MLESILGQLSAGVLIATGLLFAVAGLGKVFDLGRFSAVVADYAIVPRVLAGLVARLIVVAEMSVPLLLAIPALRTVGALLASTMLLGFAVAGAVTLAQGRRPIECGCSVGTHERPLGVDLVVRNLVWGAATFAAVNGAVLPLASRAALPAIAAGLAMALLVVAVDALASIPRLPTLEKHRA